MVCAVITFRDFINITDIYTTQLKCRYWFMSHNFDFKDVNAEQLTQLLVNIFRIAFGCSKVCEKRKLSRTNRRFIFKK